jgi:pilus assembly protein CpaE
MRLGVRDFLPPKPDEVTVSASVERLLFEHQAPVAEARRPAPLIAVFGAKGGLGATSVACQLAATLQRHGPTVIVDLDISAGDVALYFDVDPTYTLANLSGKTGALDSTYLRTLLQRHPTGVRILASPGRPGEINLVDSAHLERVFEILREEFDWVIADVGCSWSSASVRALDLSDQLLLVTAFEVPALHHTRRQLELFHRLGYERKVRLVVNRQSSADAVTGGDLTRYLKREPDVCLPNDFDTATASIDLGKPVAEVARNGGLARAYHHLARRAHEWCGVPLAEPAPSEGWIKTLLRKLRRRTDVPA